MTLGLDFVLKLRPVEYELKGGNDRTDMGFLAQEVEALLGEDYNVLTVGGDAERTLSMRYTDLIAPLVKGIQEQNRRIEDLQGNDRAAETRGPGPEGPAGPPGGTDLNLRQETPPSSQRKPAWDGSFRTARFCPLTSFMRSSGIGELERS